MPRSKKLSMKRSVWLQRFPFFVITLLFFVSSCSSVSNSPQSETTLVSNESVTVAEDPLDDRETVFIKSPNGALAKFSTEPATIESISVFVREGQEASKDEPKRVDVLVKGVFPDGCSELHELVSDLQDGVISYELVTRRPKGQMCTQAIRPFKFQFPIDSVEPGSYTIMVNDRNLAFKVEK